MWRLPGPHRFISDAVDQSRSRHVALVIPQHRANDEGFINGLANALMTELDPAGRYARLIESSGVGLGLVAEIAADAVFDDVAPTLVSELVTHEDVRGTTVVLVEPLLDQAQQDEMPAFLHSLEIASHDIGPEGRVTVVAVVTDSRLPKFAGGATTDVRLANTWWWNRVARWDAAGHLNQVGGKPPTHDLLAEVWAESIVEVARWDFGMIGHLAESWSGDVLDLADCISSWRQPEDLPAPVVRRTCGVQPIGDELEQWNEGLLDGWHHRSSRAPWALNGHEREVDRRVWAAQSRVVLPWVEESRQQVQVLAEDALGKNQFWTAVAESRGARRPDDAPADVVEIGQLWYIARSRIGNSNRILRDATFHLWRVRNDLSHLRPLRWSALTDLVGAWERLASPKR